MNNIPEFLFNLSPTVLHGMVWQQLTDGQEFPLEVLNLVSFHHNAEQLWISEIFVGNEETQIK